MQLENRIKPSARYIRDKYIVPPRTPDFAIMYLPTRGLFAEVIRRSGLNAVVHGRTKTPADFKKMKLEPAQFKLAL